MGVLYSISPRVPSAPGPLQASVSASAGYAKTKLIAEWLRDARQPVVWLTLDDDDDPIQFWADPVGALQQVETRFGRFIPTLLAAPQLPLSSKAKQSSHNTQVLGQYCEVRFA